MSWTTPRTWTDGEVPNASEFNQNIRDNENYLYANKMNYSAVQSMPTRSLGSTYTNSSGKVLFVLVTLENSDQAEFQVVIDGTPEAQVGRNDNETVYMPVSFFVEPAGTYHVALTYGSGSVYLWCETVLG